MNVVWVSWVLFDIVMVIFINRDVLVRGFECMF